MRDWSEFNRWEHIDEVYLPPRGEGDRKATQIVTAVTKLVYKWFNDGDVFDNTGFLKGWCNDLSSYANWLYKYCPEAKEVFDKWWFDKGIADFGDYEDFLYDLCEATQEIEVLAERYEVPAEGTIYKCDGPFVFSDEDDDEEEWY